MNLQNPHKVEYSTMNATGYPILHYGRILLGEIIPLISSIKRITSRWSSTQQDNEKDPLVKQLRELQIIVTHLSPNAYLEPTTFLEPFLAVIRSEDTTGPVTKNALAAVNRMLNYGLIDPRHKNASQAVDSIAKAVTHARFVGTDQGADEVVLWEILTVLRTLLLGPVGHLLTNESVCEILNSCFRICFETRLSELLRNCTEEALRHMIQLLFTRLPQFKDDPLTNKNLKMRAGLGNDSKNKGKTHSRESSLTFVSENNVSASIQEETFNSNIKPQHCQFEKGNTNSQKNRSELEVNGLSIDEIDLETKAEPDQFDVQGKENKTEDSDAVANCDKQRVLEKVESDINSSIEQTRDASHAVPVSENEMPVSGVGSEQSSAVIAEAPVELLDISHTHLAPDNANALECASVSDTKSEPEEQEKRLPASAKENTKQKTTDDFINLQGVKFTQAEERNENSLVPYGLPCVRESFRFLISLTLSTNDQNSLNMIHTALNLLTVALEVGIEHINNIPILLKLAKNQLCRNVFMLLKTNMKPLIFMASLRVCTLLFESLRTHLKFQMEMFVNKLIDIISSESSSVSYTYKELCLETIVQLWRTPGIITELFLNYDCNLYSTNLFEDLTKILSKNAFPVLGIYSTNLLALEALLAVIEVIDSHSPPDLRRKKKRGKDYEKRPVEVLTQFSSGYMLGIQLANEIPFPLPKLLAKATVVGYDEVDRKSLMVTKQKKNILIAGTEQFNLHPERGIKFLQENGLLGGTNEDIAFFLRDNPHLDKKFIGDYLSKKKNVSILSAFVKSFSFSNLRIDECVRMFLESFRLPGEAPLISIIIEHFSSHWHVSNNEPFAKDDAAFTLAYAVIMLNVDQHNQNAKKQNIPMTVEQFKNNLRGVNGGSDFDAKMLEEIYQAIHTEEIVMPAEQTGLLKENYLWKMLLKRGNSPDGNYLLTNDLSKFDKDLFSLCWGPTIASLSYVFDKSPEEPFLHKAINGFKKCASISSTFSMSEVFDNIIVSLCKFSTLVVSSNENPEHVAISFGNNFKAQIATKTIFKLIVQHGDILRKGWKSIIELLIQLFRCRILPTQLMESEDFVEHSGKVSLLNDTPISVPRVESGIFSSLYSYISMGDPTLKPLTQEDKEIIDRAKNCVKECHPEKLITESAFLRYDSLCELFKAIMGAIDSGTISDVPKKTNSPKSIALNLHDMGSGLDEHGQAFLLELIVSILIANKDRAGGVWLSIRDHIYSVLMGAAAIERQFLLERCIVAVLRVAKVLLRRPELANPILQSLRMLLLLRSHVLKKAALQVVSGIHEVLSVNADHIQEPSDWAILFALLECCGAGAKPPSIVSSPENAEDHEAQLGVEPQSRSRVDSGHFTDSRSLGASDEEPEKIKTDVPQRRNSTGNASASPDGLRHSSPENLQNPGGWILVGKEGEIEPIAIKGISVNEYDIVHQRSLGRHQPEVLLKAVETVSFLVRDRHITAASLPSVVQALRTFVEATLHGGQKYIEQRPTSPGSPKESRKSLGRKKEKQKSPAESEDEELPRVSYQRLSEKIIDLMDTLHGSSSHILNLTPDEENLTSRQQSELLNLSLWQHALCPLLQGMARYCCDYRISIRNLAMTYLQRALLNHDLQTLSAGEWEGCFNKVLFPLLAKLLQPVEGYDSGTDTMFEETRVRAATLVQKVYLRHLTPLMCLPTFTALWMTILDFMDKYLNNRKSDHLSDAIPEILKNMLLVMETTQVFHTTEGFTQVWTITWDRIDAFLPTFRNELFKSHPPSTIHAIEVHPSAQSEHNVSSSCDENVSQPECEVFPNHDRNPSSLKNLDKINDHKIYPDKIPPLTRPSSDYFQPIPVPSQPILLQSQSHPFPEMEQTLTEGTSSYRQPIIDSDQPSCKPFQSFSSPRDPSRRASQPIEVAKAYSAASSPLSCSPASPQNLEHFTAQLSLSEEDLTPHIPNSVVLREPLPQIKASSRRLEASENLKNDVATFSLETGSLLPQDSTFSNYAPFLNTPKLASVVSSFDSSIRGPVLFPKEPSSPDVMKNASNESPKLIPSCSSVQNVPMYRPFSPITVLGSLNTSPLHLPKSPLHPNLSPSNPNSFQPKSYSCTSFKNTKHIPYDFVKSSQLPARSRALSPISSNVVQAPLILSTPNEQTNISGLEKPLVQAAESLIDKTLTNETPILEQSSEPEFQPASILFNKPTSEN